MCKKQWRGFWGCLEEVPKWCEYSPPPERPEMAFIIMLNIIHFIDYERLSINALLFLLKEKASYFLGLPQYHFLSCPLWCLSHSIMQRKLSVVSSFNLSASVSSPVKQGSSSSLSCQPHSLALSRQWDYIAWVVSSDRSGFQPCSAMHQVWTSLTLYFLIGKMDILPSLWSCPED